VPGLAAGAGSCEKGREERAKIHWLFKWMDGVGVEAVEPGHGDCPACLETFMSTTIGQQSIERDWGVPLHH